MTGNVAGSLATTAPRARSRAARAGLIGLVVVAATAGQWSGATAKGNQPPVGPTPGDPATSYIAEFADSTWDTGRTRFHVAPGQVRDRGVTTETVDIQVTRHECSGRYLITTDVAGTPSAADLPGVDVDARGGTASVKGTFSLSGNLTVVPAGRGCWHPKDHLAVTTPVTIDVDIDASWTNLRRSTPLEYTGEECGGTGQCFYRDASGRATLSSDFFGQTIRRTARGFFFEGVYASEAEASAVPAVFTES